MLSSDNNIIMFFETFIINIVILNCGCQINFVKSLKSTKLAVLFLWEKKIMMFKLQKTASDVRAMIQPLFCLFNEVQNLKLHQSRKGNK